MVAIVPQGMAIDEGNNSTEDGNPWGIIERAERANF